MKKKKKKEGKYVGLVITRESVTIYPEWSETRADQPRVLQWLALTPQQVTNETILRIRSPKNVVLYTVAYPLHYPLEGARSKPP